MLLLFGKLPGRMSGKLNLVVVEHWKFTWSTTTYPKNMIFLAETRKIGGIMFMC
jgi:hypothetical protein